MTEDTLKDTSWTYGDDYQSPMAEKYRNRSKNHWKDRISLGFRLFDDYVKPGLKSPPNKTLVVDVGCSIGTFALEFARRGFRTVGVDFDPDAIKAAKALALEEELDTEFVCQDVAAWDKSGFPKIDVAICFDLFEHLHDDEIGGLLQALKKIMSKKGAFIFSTTPTQYSYLYYSGKSWRLSLVRLVLLPFTLLPSSIFERILRAMAALLDALMLLVRGKDHRELIKRKKHCNPLTRDRLEDIFQRAGYRLETVETTNLHPSRQPIERAFRRHPICHTHIIGVAFPNK